MTSTLHPVADAAHVSAALAAPWWRDAVIYEVYVRSFADSNGDGIGDLAGIRDKVPYLADLGVDALWLTPFYTSPMADGGYDVADYRNVDPLFGSLSDFDALIDTAHEHGLRIIVDVVPNHTSAAHPWFVEALNTPPGSVARDRYLFRPGRGTSGELPPNDWESIFGGPAWTRICGTDRAPEQWYLHLFDSAQPDLNWDNPQVRAEFEDVLRFWLERGVDGFRIDVAHGMVKAPGLPDVGRDNQINLLGNDRLPYFDQDGVHEIYRRWRQLFESYPGDRVGVAEAWAPDFERLANYTRADELHQAFNFHFLGTAWDADALRHVITESLAAAGQVGAPSTWVLSNHDVHRHVTRFGGGSTGLARARAAALLMLALPGSVYLYQGEELGLAEVLDLPEETLQDPMWERSGRTQRGRDGCRVPLPWSAADAAFGFTTGTPWLPQPAAWADLAADRQRDDPESILSLYRAALRLRRTWTGDLRFLDSPDGVLTFVRGDWACTVNVRDEPVAIEPPGVPVLSSGAPIADSSVLPASIAVWWQVGSPNVNGEN